jgi:uroporphyrinogen-III decarboxylase
MKFECKLREQWSIKSLDVGDMIERDWQKNPKDIAMLARMISDKIGKNFYQLPYCNTIEAEDLGAVVKYANEESTNRVSEAICKSADEARELLERALTEKSDMGERAKALYLGIAELKKEGRPIIFNITGPITILSYIVDMNVLIKLKRKEPEFVEKLENFVLSHLKEYISYFKSSGVDLFSYADPVGNIDILGKRYFEKWTKPLSHKMIEIFEEAKVPVHVCGMLSCELEDSNEFNFLQGSGKLVNELPKKFKVYGKSCIQHW